MSHLDPSHVPHLTHMHVFHQNRLFVDCLATALNCTSNYRVSAVDHDSLFSANKLLGGPRQVVLVHAALPDKLAIRAIGHLKANHPQAKILALVPHDDSDAVIDCIAAGATGCVVEESSLQELCTAIDRTAGGETFCSPQLVNSMFAQISQLTRPSITSQIAAEAPLTRRENEILGLLAEGLTNQDIATQLSVSLYTVKNHVHNILEKLDVENRFHAIEHARRRRLLPRTRVAT